MIFFFWIEDPSTYKNSTEYKKVSESKNSSGY